MLNALGLVELSRHPSDDKREPRASISIADHNLQTSKHAYRIKKQRWAPTGLGDRVVESERKAESADDNSVVEGICQQLQLDQATALEVDKPSTFYGLQKTDVCIGLAIALSSLGGES